MKTQITRLLQEDDARYASIHLQDGRMLAAADWNAMSDLVQRRLESALSDVIGSGTPEQAPLIEADTSGGATTYRLVWGRVYVDGIPAAVVPDPTATLDDPAGTVLEYAHQADLPAGPPLPAGDHLLYVDVWDRTVLALEDPRILDPGLHGADTTTRRQTLAQVKWCPLDFDPEDPTQNPPIGAAPVTLTLRRAATERDPCDPCADEIELQDRVGNYLFRVEVHAVDYDAGGAATRAVLKWSRENGGEVARVGEEPPGFTGADWVFEFFHGPAAPERSASEKHLGFHPQQRGGAWTPQRAVLVPGYPESAPAGFSLVRRWDGYIILERAAGWVLASDSEGALGADRGVRLSTTSASDAHAHVVEGAAVEVNADVMHLRLDLADHPLLAGDFWLAEVREAIHDLGDELLTAGLPVGIRHHYLAIARMEAGVLTPVRGAVCRRHAFPRMTNLRAEDVCYDARRCEIPDAHTVQEAIDRLCEQRDLRWHNRHLHGWGIVCGLIVECGPDTAPPEADEAGETVEPARRQVRLTPGYAIDCAGNDIVLEAERVEDVMARIEAHDAGADEPFLADGDGTVCLTLERDAEGNPSIGLAPYARAANPWLDGTLLMDFVQDCVGDLLDALRAEFRFLDEAVVAAAEDEAGEPLVSAERRHLTALLNLIVQLLNNGNGSYVFLSRKEHDILRGLYLRLRDLLQSRTFCAMFAGDDFPAYPFDESGMSTFFGKGAHTRAVLHPQRQRLYTYGGTDNTINVYDAAGEELIEVLVMATAEGAEVSAVTFSPDGGLLYAAATVRGVDTVFGLARVGADGHTWEPMTVICNLEISEMQVAPRDDQLIYAIGRGRGLFFLRPGALRDAPQPSLVPVYAFNAIGHMAFDADNDRIWATANSSPAAEPERYDRVVAMDLAVESGTDLTPSFVLPLRDATGAGLVGEDGLALRPGPDALTLYVIANAQTGKRVLTYTIRALDAGLAPGAVLAIEATRVTPRYHGASDSLLLAMEDGYRLERVRADGQASITFRIPVQIQPIDVVVDPVEGQVFTLNYLSNTLSRTPRDGLDVDDAFLDALADYRREVLLAFYALLGGLLQYLKDCFCDHLLVKCPTCGDADLIYLGAVEIRANRIYKVCNFEKRKYVKSFPAVEYWLSLIPIIPAVKELFTRLCCAIVPDLFSTYQDTVMPAPPTAGSGSLAARQNRLSATTTRNSVRAYRRTNLNAIYRDQLRGLDVYRVLTQDAVMTRVESGAQPPAGIRKQRLVNAQVTDARRELEESHVEVAAVEDYDPQRADEYQSLFRGTPQRIEPGSTVRLVQRDGRVLFYAVDRPTGAVAGVDPAVREEIAALEARKAALGNLVAVNAALDTVEARREAAADVSTIDAQITDLAQQRTDLETQIAGLRSEVASIRSERETEAQRLEQLAAQRTSLATSITSLNASLAALAESQQNLRTEIARDRPVRDVDGVTSEVDAALREAGIRTVGELASADPATLRRAGVAADEAAVRSLVENANLRMRR